MITLTHYPETIERLQAKLRATRQAAARYRNQRDEARAECAVLRSQVDRLLDSTEDDQ